MQVVFGEIGMSSPGRAFRQSEEKAGVGKGLMEREASVS